MGKLISFDIIFNPCQAVFFAGGAVRGSVKLELRDAMKMRAVRMTCFGRAYVHWSEVENVGHRGGRQRVEAVEHNAEEEYFQFRFNLWPKTANATETLSLSAGQHTFPFQLQLPADLPPSFEGAYGYIRYWTKATIDKPWKIDHHTKRAFTVLPKLDLNKEPGVVEPIRYHGEIRGGCCCIPSGRFSGSFTTNCRGFVPGSEIVIQSEIENHTSSSCWAEINLRLLITYLAGGKFKQEKKIVATLSKDQIPRGKEYLWTEAMKVPSLPPSYLKGCKLIKAQYKLQFQVGSDARCSCDNIEFEDEIIIGTLPWVEKPQTHAKDKDIQAANQRSVLVQAPTKGAPPSSATAIILDSSQLLGGDIPSSYEECVLFGKVSIKDKDDTEHTLGELVFTPLYALYSHPQEGRTTNPIKEITQ